MVINAKVLLISLILFTSLVVSLGVNIPVTPKTNPYGEVYGVDIGQVVINTQGVYENITNVTMGNENQVTFSGGGMVVQVPGLYSIKSGFSFSGSANTEYHLGLGVNGQRSSNCHAERKIGTGGDVGNAGFTCLERFLTGDNITIMIENVDSTTNPTIHDINLNFVFIGV